MMLNVFVGQVDDQGTNIYLPLEQMGDVEVEFDGVICSVGCAKLVIVQLVQEHLEENPYSGVSPEKDETLSGLLQLPIVMEVFSSPVCPRAPESPPLHETVKKVHQKLLQSVEKKAKVDPAAVTLTMKRTISTKCRICKEVFSTMKKLKVHIRKMHKDHRYICIMCEVTLQSGVFFEEAHR